MTTGCRRCWAGSKCRSLTRNPRATRISTTQMSPRPTCSPPSTGKRGCSASAPRSADRTACSPRRCRWATHRCPASRPRTSAGARTRCSAVAQEFHGKTIGIAGEHVTGERLAAGLARVYDEPVRYQSLPLDVFRSLPVPGIEVAANMFQYVAEANEDYCRRRDVRLARRLNPSLLDFGAWIARTRAPAGPGRCPMEPHELIFSMTNAGVAARCLHVVAELGVADHIQDRPVPATELAQQVRRRPGRAEPGAPPADRARRVLLRQWWIPAHPGIPAAAQRQPDVDARLPADDGPAGGAEVLRRTGPLGPHRSAVDRAQRSRRSVGLPQWGTCGTRGVRSSHEREGGGRHRAVLAAYDFSSARRIVDVGGGRGHLLHAVLEATPQARGILFDLSGVVEAGGPAHPRLVRQAGDFFVDPLPAGDTYLVMDVLHDWADADALAILAAIRRAATDDARVLIIEGILPEHLDPGSLSIDVIMLAVTGGRERTVDELAESPRRGRLTTRAGHRHPRAAPDRRGAPRETGGDLIGFRRAPMRCADVCSCARRSAVGS